MRSLDDVEKLISFFEARQGQLYGFRWKDWSEFRAVRPSREISFDDQIIANGDGVTASFQLLKTYRSGPSSYARPIQKPVEGTVRIGIAEEPRIEGADYEVDTSTGLVPFAHPPDVGAEITAGFEFDVPARFDTDAIKTSVAAFRAGDAPSVPVVEVRV